MLPLYYWEVSFFKRLFQSGLYVSLLLLGLWASNPAAAAASVVRIEPGQATASLASQIEFWVDPSGDLQPDVVEAAGQTLPFALQSLRQVHLLEGKARRWKHQA